MARCRGSVLVGQIAKPTDVFFSSNPQISYINDLKAADLGLPLKIEDTTTTIRGVLGGTSDSTRTASIKLVLGIFQHIVKAIVLPGSLPYLVLGADWFRRYNPMIRFRENTMTIMVPHTIQMEDEDEASTSLFAPCVTVVSRTANSKVRADDKSRLWC